MATIAIYNSKGGVGKTTIAINLALNAVQKKLRTLLWEIDGQGDSNWLLATIEETSNVDASAFMHGISDVLNAIRPSKIPGVSILRADADLRRTENFLIAFSRQNRLERLFVELKTNYDVIILDCPPGFNETARKLLLVVDLVVVPVIPSPLSFLGLTRIRDFMKRHRGWHPPILPVFSMVDLRRKTHKKALEEHPDWPIIGMSSKIENMTLRDIPIGNSVSTRKYSTSFESLWKGIEQKLRKLKLLRVPASPE